jgi:hypothetical protein
MNGPPATEVHQPQLRHLRIKFVNALHVRRSKVQAEGKGRACLIPMRPV